MSEPGSATNADAGHKPADNEDKSAGPEGDSATAVATEPEASVETAHVVAHHEVKKPWWVRHYTFTGTAVGLIFIWFSMTPSLLPRGPLFQALVSGFSGAIGYGLGVFSVWLVRYMREKQSSPPPPRWAWKVLIPVAVVGQVLMAIWFHVWQDDVRDLMGVTHLKWYDYPLTAILSLIVLFTLVEIGQAIRMLFSFLVGQLDRIAPFRVSAPIVVILLVTLTITLLNGVVIKFTMRTLNNTFASVNTEMNPDTTQPTTPLRSGGPQSLVSWESLGHQGRIFIKGGPRTDDLTTFNGAAAIEPVRAYAGLNSADGITATAELAARELQRAGGLQRAVVAVGTTTGA